ncbi:CHAP domain-containing protein [Rhizosaccharibacter radicis]|uniref:CHAP domain-containing protein n=1 Tax=Rhizosaccharibacter radicis TaxID=2782605 RepID=A0ABT1W0A3_9PROT|nr:CHAP domain-containing protein [Acetobacteraceae bacterium KSS12]
MSGLLLSALLLLAGCGGGGPQCGPYARSVTGLPLSGPAAGWWAQSDGRFAHSARPRPGAVLVFRRTGRLPDGHVSVVRAVVARRRIMVEHANWEPGRIDRAVPVTDVSPGNDWSLVRVWWAPSRRMGRTIYPTFGFILPAN